METVGLVFNLFESQKFVYFKHQSKKTVHIGFSFPAPEGFIHSCRWHNVWSKGEMAPLTQLVTGDIHLIYMSPKAYVQQEFSLYLEKWRWM